MEILIDVLQYQISFRLTFATIIPKGREGGLPRCSAVSLGLPEEG
jgi:hypothetical protein